MSRDNEHHIPRGTDAARFDKTSIQHPQRPSHPTLRTKWDLDEPISIDGFSSEVERITYPAGYSSSRVRRTALHALEDTSIAISHAIIRHPKVVNTIFAAALFVNMFGIRPDMQNVSTKQDPKITLTTGFTS